MKSTIAFIEGPISPQNVTQHLAEVSGNTEVGGIDIFLGNIRADRKEEGEVTAIDFTKHETLAQAGLEAISQEIAAQFDVQHVVILHSVGHVKAGELCMAVITGCKHRKDAYASNIEIVERLKKEVPIWGKELLEGDRHVWKENTK